MDPGRPSRTAEAVAFMRALHLAVDDQPAVLADHVAAALLPAPQQRFLQRLPRLANPFLARFRSRDALTRMRSQVLVRQRFTEDKLQQAVAKGAGHYLVLGAGLDTFALRRPEQLQVDVIEVDHPDTQRWKQQLVQRHLANEQPAPGTLAAPPVWCAVDFEQDQLSDRLPLFTAPVFVAWLGVSYYLSDTAIRGTLTSLAESLPPGSELVLDYWTEPLAPEDFADRLLLWGARLGVALQQEPMHSFFKPAAIAALASSCGWRVLADLSADQQNSRYLQGRSDGLTVPAFAHVLHLARPG